MCCEDIMEILKAYVKTRSEEWLMFWKKTALISWEDKLERIFEYFYFGNPELDLHRMDKEHDIELCIGWQKSNFGFVMWSQTQFFLRVIRSRIIMITLVKLKSSFDSLEAATVCLLTTILCFWCYSVFYMACVNSSYLYHHSFRII